MGGASPELELPVLNTINLRDLLNKVNSVPPPDRRALYTIDPRFHRQSYHCHWTSFFVRRPKYIVSAHFIPVRLE